MLVKILNRAALIGVMLLVVATAISAFAASNSVPESGADAETDAVTANALKPDGCSTLDLSNVVSGSGDISDGSASSLITGSSLVDTISGGGGDDCILGGAGDDDLSGGSGTDHCYGGGGNDTFDASCEITEQ